MNHYVLFYEFASDYLERRPTYRTEHLQLAWAAHARGEFVLGGAFDPADSAMLIFQGETEDVARAFAEHDPYVREGLVTSWQVRLWRTVAGDLATNPIKP